VGFLPVKDTPEVAAVDVGVTVGGTTMFLNSSVINSLNLIVIYLT
jgi:hypothetical protein